MAIVENGLSIITVKKKDLLETLKKNRDAHQVLFAEAKQGYQKALIEELSKKLEDAKSGKDVEKFIAVDQPTDHTRDYDKVIKMLEMSVSDEIKVSEHEFTSYVLDEWNWKGAFIATTANYVGRAVR